MKKIVAYLLLFLAALIYCIVLNLGGTLDALHAPIRVGITSAVVGGVGGCLYCLRSVYLSVSVRKVWDPNWEPWYFIRPIVSLITGGISYVFLRAGLLILESATRPDSTELGFYALAFIAGLNVDKFVSKLEDVAQAVWGIEKSRASAARQDEK